MFSLLSQMITKANLSGMTLMVRPTGQGRLSVVICAESTDWKADDANLKAALTQPLVIEGEVMALEEQLISDLATHSESFVRAVVSSNASKVSAAHDAAASASSATPTHESENVGADDTDDDAPINVGAPVTDNDLF
ncbi:MAG TPA: hypothetical protein DCR58_01990 [Idiomarina baltica]|uniref:PRTRC system protein E n=2 Tax=Alteromonadales TaxID=135622 RepID=A0A358DYK6_9ALTE|nr:hypothetical protein [Alteromonas australica]HAR55537.1 hypothetical protein [Idiomarina baltica]HBU51359.1 hypothetical protein [Alteromonas australica]|tara:strand:- start:21084 stop:21494 length:411 start_codon:yes stop_codon:yes gene_type:complete